jgi:hypothetical protein
MTKLEYNKEKGQLPAIQINFVLIHGRETGKQEKDKKI